MRTVKEEEDKHAAEYAIETTGFGPSSCATGVTSSQPGRPEKLAISRVDGINAVFGRGVALLRCSFEPFHFPKDAIHAAAAGRGRELRLRYQNRQLERRDRFG
jgi:hypothetical protein